MALGGLNVWQEPMALLCHFKCHTLVKALSWACDAGWTGGGSWGVSVSNEGTESLRGCGEVAGHSCPSLAGPPEVQAAGTPLLTCRVLDTWTVVSGAGLHVAEPLVHQTSVLLFSSGTLVRFVSWGPGTSNRYRGTSLYIVRGHANSIQGLLNFHIGFPCLFSTAV